MSDVEIPVLSGARTPYRPMTTEDARRRVPRSSGVLVIVVIMALMYLLRTAKHEIPNPAACLLFGVAVSSVIGRIRIGLASALMAIAFSTAYFSLPGHLFTYNPTSAELIVINGILLVATAVAVGGLRLHNDRLVDDRIKHIEEAASERARADFNLSRFAELESIIESMPAGVYIGTVDGLTMCNRIGLEMLGYKTREKLVADFDKLFDMIEAHWIDNGQAVNQESRPFAYALAGKSLSRDMRYRRIDTQEEVIARCAVAPITVDGAIVASVAIYTDITERTRMENALRDSEDSYRRLIQTANEGIWLVDLEGRTTFANERLAKMLGTTPVEMLGRHYVDYVGPDACTMTTLLQNQDGAEQHDVRIARADGSVVWTLISTNPILDKDGTCTGLLAMVTDITDRKRAEAEVQAIYQREHRIAETLQRSLLLDQSEIRFPGYFVDSYYQPALEEAMVGGDFFDAFQLDGGLAAFVVGDVSGKGLAAAAHTAEVKFTLRALLREYPSATLAMARMNDVLCDRVRLEQDSFEGFICLVVIVADTRTGEIDLAIAGAEPPMVIRANASSEVLAANGGLPLGVLPKQSYNVHKVNMSEGDILLVTTDGLTEARKSPAQFGLEGICEAAISARKSASLKLLAEAVVKAATDYADGHLTDDVCLLAIQRLLPHQYLPAED